MKNMYLVCPNCGKPASRVVSIENVVAEYEWVPDPETAVEALQTEIIDNEVHEVQYFHTGGNACISYTVPAGAVIWDGRDFEEYVRQVKEILDAETVQDIIEEYDGVSNWEVAVREEMDRLNLEGE